MSFPEGIAFLDWANGLLVADEGNNRVDFYNKDGKFRNHILVECDGVLSPQGIWFRSYRRYRRFYPIITIHISLFTTNLSEYDISFFTLSHHSCNKSDYRWVRRSSTEIVSFAVASNWLQKLVDTSQLVVWIKLKLQFLISLKIQITKFHSGIVDTV